MVSGMRATTTTPMSATPSPVSSDRWSSWMGRARACFRVAGAIDSTSSTLVAIAREFDAANDDAAREAACALRLAESALVRARAAVQAALEAKRLTPENREPSYGVSGSSGRRTAALGH
jgi:hypothetical protein